MNCKNCNKELIQHSRYCNHCGAKVIKNRLTFKNLIASFSVQFFNYDNKFLKTFIDLFKNPEDVINGYINGVRKRYVNPISYFTIALTILGLQMYIINRYFPEVLDISNMALKGNEEIANNTMKSILKHQAITFAITLPIYALISFFTFKTLKRYNYTEHLVFFLYTTPQMTFMSFFPQLLILGFGVTIGELNPFILIIQVLYTAFCFKRVFNISFKGVILRTLFFIALLIIGFIVITVCSVVLNIIYYGGIEEFVKAQQAIQDSTKVN